MDMIQEIFSPCPFKIHPTGSRHFENSHADSDWDFFAEYTEDNINWLLQNGFKLIPRNNDVSDNKKVVQSFKGREFTHIDYHNITDVVHLLRREFANTHIDIQMVKNVDVRVGLQEKYFEKIKGIADKAKRRDFWRWIQGEIDPL